MDEVRRWVEKRKDELKKDDGKKSKERVHHTPKDKDKA